MSSWWDAVRSWFRNGREGGFPEPDRKNPDVQHFSGRENWISRRKNLTTSLGSREISEVMSAKIRAQAFFSARVAEGHILDRLRDVSDAFTRGETGQAEARTRLKQFLVSEGYDPQNGSLSNLASTARLNLILEQNARMGYAVGRWQEGMDPDIKERFPCWRYVGSTALSPRDSHARYAGHVYAKDDPVWHSIFPPSDFGCKCSVEDCDDPPEKAPKEITPPESGFAFDPAHAFEKFDYDAIKDAELREKTRDGVEKILAEESQTGRTKPAETPYMNFQTGLSQPRTDELMMLMRQDPQKGIEDLAEELEKTITPEMLKDIKAKKTREQCIAEARAAVPPEVMKRTADYVASLPEGALEPLYKYTNKDEDGVNKALRRETQPPEELAKISAFSKLLENGPKYEGICFRGCYFGDGETALNFVNDLILNPEQKRGFTSLSPDFATALYYASKAPGHVIIVIPESSHGVYWGPYSSQPRDHETTLDCKFFLKGLAFCRKCDTLYVLAEEIER